MLNARLALLSRQWFPVVVTDRNMPGIDGLELTSRLRALATVPIYVIMLTSSGDARDYERGYCAGVDHYLSKQGFEKELVAKVVSGVSAIRRRRACPKNRTRFARLDISPGSPAGARSVS